MAKKRRKIEGVVLALLISLLIHLFLVIGLIVLTTSRWFGFSEEPNNLDTSQEENSLEAFPDEEKVAALKSRGSDFGAPVIFHDDPPQEPEQETEPPEQTEQEESKSEEESETQQETPEPPAEQKPQAVVEEPSPNVLQQEPQKIEEPTPEPPRRKRRRRRRPRPTQAAAPQPDRPTMAQLAQGFLASLQHGGEDWFDRAGDESIRPDLQEMKYLSYLQKIYWRMQNEWGIHRSKLTMAIPQNMVLSVTIRLAQDGTLQALALDKSTGMPDIDTYLMKGIRTASPYPALPQHFNTDTFTHQFSILVQADPHNAPRRTNPAAPLRPRR